MMSIGFYVAPFAASGESQGVAIWQLSDLSREWLDLSRRHLADIQGNGVFAWDGDLSRVQTRVTSSSSAAIVSFSINCAIASSLLLLRGVSAQQESEVSKLFIASLRKNPLAAELGGDAFGKILLIRERPLAVVIPWPDPLIVAEDHELVRDLGIHLSGAFLNNC
jgi:hypothetical protein